MTNQIAHVPPRRRMPRALRDFVLGLTLFTVVAMTGLAGAPDGSGLLSNPAHARFYEIEPTGPELAAGYALRVASPSQRSVEQQVLAVSSLALAFAAVFAFNLWLVRHLRQVHAWDRRRRR
jgi:hypothetical protein